MKVAPLLGRALRTLKDEGLLNTAVKTAKYPFRPYLSKRKLRAVLSHADAEARFTHIFRSNTWSSTGSISGGGSTLRYTERLRAELPGLIDRFAVTSILDAPCGDFLWMQHVLAERPIDYTGIDIVRPLIEDKQARHGGPNVRFVHGDLTKGPLPKADLMICRDCLFHLSYRDTAAALASFLQSGCAYLLTTTHMNRGDFENDDIPTGSFRRIDLFAAPFHFPGEVAARIEDWIAPDFEREMCLWTRAQVEDAMIRARPDLAARAVH